MTNVSFNPFIIAFDTSLDFIIWMHQVQSYPVSIQVFANCIIRQNAFLSISANAPQLVSRSAACKKDPPSPPLSALLVQTLYLSQQLNFPLQFQLWTVSWCQPFLSIATPQTFAHFQRLKKKNLVVHHHQHSLHHFQQHHGFSSPPAFPSLAPRFCFLASFLRRPTDQHLLCESTRHQQWSRTTVIQEFVWRLSPNRHFLVKSGWNCPNT